MQEEKKQERDNDYRFLWRTDIEILEKLLIDLKEHKKVHIIIETLEGGE